MFKLTNKIASGYKSLGQYLGAAVAAPSKMQAQIGLFLLGVVLLSAGMEGVSFAQITSGETDSLGEYNDERISEAVNRIFGYLEGSFGALIMVAAGLGAIISSAFGQYRAALGLLVVAVGAFILRSLVSTFFNADSIG